MIVDGLVKKKKRLLIVVEVPR